MQDQEDEKQVSLDAGVDTSLNSELDLNQTAEEQSQQEQIRYVHTPPPWWPVPWYVWGVGVGLVLIVVIGLLRVWAFGQ